MVVFFFQAEDGIRDWSVTGVQTCALPICFLDRMHLPMTMRDNYLYAYAKQTGGNFDGEFWQRGIETSFAKIATEVRSEERRVGKECRSRWWSQKKKKKGK